MSTRKESDLYAPIKAFLEQQGFAVKGEVNGCDMAAVRGDDLVLVELKVAFNLALVLQGIERQRAADLVYVAVEAPKSARAVPRWNDCITLCRRLNLGLLTVSFAAHRDPRVDVICEPGPYQPKRDLKGRARLVREFTLRSGDFNTGGVNRRPVVTAYRESALLVAEHLRQYGPSPPKAIKAATKVEKTGTILQDDVYGWFERIAKGVYQVSPKGLEALQTYADVVACKHEAD